MPSITRRNNSQRSGQFEMAMNWQHTQEISPAFKRLVMLLLKPLDNQSAEMPRPDEEHQNEQC